MMQLSVPADQLVAIDVVLGRPNGVYRPGDRLTGHVVIDAKQDIPLCGKPGFHSNAIACLASSQSWLPLLRPSIPIGWRLRLLREIFTQCTQRKRLRLNGNWAVCLNTP